MIRTDIQGIARFRQLMEGRFDERLSFNSDVRATHGRGEAFHAPKPPQAVCFVRSTEEVREVVLAAAACGLAIVPYGAGTSLEGGVTAPAGGVCIDMSGMDAILDVSVGDLDCAVQSGVTRERLNLHLRDMGLMFPIDPGADATIGGMAATRASGTTAVRYGTMRENVLWLTVVLPDGRVVRTAKRARKSSAGYDLTRLFIGSEGTLGIITEVGLRLHGVPECAAAAVCSFDTLEGATRCVIETLQMGVPVARAELMDPVMVRACNAYSRTNLLEKPTLFFEFHGSEAGVREQAETVGTLAEGNGGSAFEWATCAEDRNRLWRARHAAYHAAQALVPGSELIVTDVCVPISHLAQCVVETHADLENSGAIAPIVGHVGDGNFHVFLSVDPAEQEQVERARELNDRLVARALAAGGTCTGEHGIGVGKQGKLVDELGEDAVDLMRLIKASIDPTGIMNPGKIFRAADAGSSRHNSSHVSATPLRRTSSAGEPAHV